MKTNYKSYPHPVLGNGDDIAGSFSAEFQYELGRDSICLNPKFKLENQGVAELLKKNTASFVLEVECPSAFYRNFFSTLHVTEKFSIPASRLRDKVVVSFYICANEAISGYNPSDCHPDYQGAVFEIEKGDVVALGGSCSFIAEKAFDPLRPPVSSFMRIMEGTSHEGPMQIDYDADKITIVLSKEDWKNYCGARGQKMAEGILHSFIVFPVLADAIYQVVSENSEFSDKNWYGRLEVALDAKRLRDKEPFESAQKILENPASRSFEGIMSLLEVPNDQEDYE